MSAMALLVLQPKQGKPIPLSCTDFCYHSRLSALYRLQIKIRLETTQLIDPEKLSSCQKAIFYFNDHSRVDKQVIHGIVNEYHWQYQAGLDQVEYDFIIVPHLSQLQQARTLGIYAKASRQDIVRRVLDRHKLRYDFHLRHNESVHVPLQVPSFANDFDFLTRLLVPDWCYYFKQEAEAESVVFVDSVYHLPCSPWQIDLRTQKLGQSNDDACSFQLQQTDYCWQAITAKARYYTPESVRESWQQLTETQSSLIAEYDHAYDLHQQQQMDALLTAREQNQQETLCLIGSDLGFKAGQRVRLQIDTGTIEGVILRVTINGRFAHQVLHCQVCLKVQPLTALFKAWSCAPKLQQAVSGMLRAARLATQAQVNQSGQYKVNFPHALLALQEEDPSIYLRDSQVTCTKGGGVPRQPRCQQNCYLCQRIMGQDVG